jgi:hypothetical protein
MENDGDFHPRARLSVSFKQQVTRNGYQSFERLFESLAARTSLPLSYPITCHYRCTAELLCGIHVFVPFAEMPLLKTFNGIPAGLHEGVLASKNWCRTE